MRDHARFRSPPTRRPPPHGGRCGSVANFVLLSHGALRYNGTMKIPLSVLDLSPVVSGGTSAQALHNSVRLAQRADALGYTRHWFAEHHNMPMIASTNPAIMVAITAAATQRIRVGAGGVMLPNHAPLQVAEAYRMLASLHPGRIDLGLGRAPGTDPRTAHALRRALDPVGADDFPQQLAELLAFGHQGFPAHHPYASVRAMPFDTVLPPVWLLGSSGFSADLAARCGLPFAFAAHFSPSAPEAPMLAYRRGFQPSPDLEKPYAMLALSVICADTEEEAEILSEPMRLAWARLRTGMLGPLPSPQEARAHRFSSAERDMAELYRQLQILGAPHTVKARIEDFVQRTQADEVIITTVTHDHAARVHSYALLAAAFSLDMTGNAAENTK